MPDSAVMTATPQTDNFLAAKDIWDTIFPSLPESLLTQTNVQVPKGCFTEWFSTIATGLRHVETEGSDLILHSIYWPGITTLVSQVQGHMNTAVLHGANWLQQTSGQLQTFLWSIRSSLIWLIPLPDDAIAAYRVPRVLEITSQAKEIYATSLRVEKEEKNLGNLIKNVKTASEDVNGLLEKIAGYERTASTSNTNAAASAQGAEVEKQKIDGHVSELEEAIAKQRALFEEFEKKRELVDATLQGASRVALAKSFDDRRRTLFLTQLSWALVFMVGTVALTWLGVNLSTDFLEHANNVAAGIAASNVKNTANVSLSWEEQSAFVRAALRFLVLAPLVWLTWFAARQYSHSQRLGEDYSFKSAAAHAYVGYKNEMDDDVTMLAMLREYAIKNFGENPIRVLSKNEPVSPLNDLWEKTLEKIEPNKLADLLKELVSKAKT